MGRLKNIPKAIAREDKAKGIGGNKTSPSILANTKTTTVKSSMVVIQANRPIGVTKTSTRTPITTSKTKSQDGTHKGIQTNMKVITRVRVIEAISKAEITNIKRKDMSMDMVPRMCLHKNHLKKNILSHSPVNTIKSRAALVKGDMSTQVFMRNTVIMKVIRIRKFLVAPIQNIQNQPPRKAQPTANRISGKKSRV